MIKWIFLSYPLNNKAFAYGNCERFKLIQTRSISSGQTSNNTTLEMPVHYGTHIDFPYHFCNEGHQAHQFNPEFFIFNYPAVIDISANQLTDYLICNQHLKAVEQLSKQTDCLIIKTGFCNKRYTNEYWQYGWGFHKQTAAYLKQHLPNLRVIGFDLISLNSYQQREHGREAHKAFLCEYSILIVEEMDLSAIQDSTTIEQIIISPLIIEGGDGAPVTVFAKINV